jgi:hypothetical protein
MFKLYIDGQLGIPFENLQDAEIKSEQQKEMLKYIQGLSEQETQRLKIFERGER